MTPSSVDVSDPLAAIAGASNRLTAEWAGRIRDGRSTVFSGAGVWPLLGLLALGADGDCRDQLAAAYGLDPALGGSAARTFVDLFDRAPALQAAVGLWYKDDLPIRQPWLDELPPATRGRLTQDPRADQHRLDAWARDHTRGLVDRMPVSLRPDTELILASAIMVSTEWRTEFGKRVRHVQAGPWAGRAIPALTRRILPSELRVVDGGPGVGQVTAVVVEGENDIDVVLFLGGPQVAAAKVLRAGTGAFCVPRDHAWPGERATGLLGGGTADRPLPPGVSLTTVPADSPEPTALLSTTPFKIHAAHDLLATPDVFGLTAAADRATADFPGVSTRPLVLESARQNAMAEFTKTGFRAAAVTDTGLIALSAMTRPRNESVRIDITYDRPFGFAALHRASGLVVAAGWVAEV
ncbi:MAG TPA: serpin family protein [Actinocrinis sp.]|nr:serpin family protein [Actinocrinis sp.]